MATYYVDFVNGLDANNGLGPDASAVTNKPWKTIAKLLGASGMASGDTAYLSPAGPFREVVTVAMTSATVKTMIIGDYANAQGFKTSGGALVTPGIVRWTARTTSDIAAPSSTPPLTLGGRDFLTFQDMLIQGGNNANQACVDGNTANSTDITFRRCWFLAEPGHVVTWTTAAGVAANLTFDSCVFQQFSGQGRVLSVNQTRHTADYDANILFENCVGIAGLLVQENSTGAGAGFGGGVRIRNCSFIGIQGFFGTGASVAVSIPSEVCNSFFTGNNAMCSASSSGNIVEDYNLVQSSNVRTNTSIGPFTVSGATPVLSPMFHMSYEVLWGFQPRPFLSPMAGGGALGFGNVIFAVGRTATVIDDATVGTIAWTTPANASVPDGTSTTASTLPGTTGVSHYLNAQSFTGFAGIPSDATIKSIRVELIVLASVATGVSCSSVKLLKAGVITGNDLASSNTTVFTTSAVIHSWGSTADPLWGTTWTVAQVQAAGFGAVWAAKNVNAATRDCSVDFIRVIVAYTTVDGAGGVATDMLSATRPAGGNSTSYAVGALERGNTATVQSTTVHTGGGSAWKITGPGYHDLRCNVDAASVVLGIYAQYDTAGQQPTVTLKAAPELGIANDVALTWSDPGANAWAQFTTTTVPTAAGVVTLRLATAAGTGIAYFDDASST